MFRIGDVILGRISRMARDRQGSVLVIFALSFLVLIAIAGMGTDYFVATLARTRAEAAADAAALKALEITKAKLASQESFSQATGEGIAAGMAAYRAQLGSVASAASMDAPDLRIERSSDGRSIQASVTFGGAISNVFMKILGVERTRFGSTITASLPLKKYIHLTFLLDTSQSMGIGGDNYSLTRMKNDPQLSCQFACHDSTTMYNIDLPDAHLYRGGDNYYLHVRCDLQPRRGRKVLLRIDYLRQAVTSILQKVSQSLNEYTASIAIYGTIYQPTIMEPQGQRGVEPCPGDPSKTVSFYKYSDQADGRLLSDTSNNQLDVAEGLLQDLQIEDLATVTYLKNELAPASYWYAMGANTSGAKTYGLTMTDSNLSWLGDNLPMSGTGVSQDDPIQVVVMVSDGTQERNVWDAPVPAAPITSSLCDRIKGEKKATMIVLYTTYLPFSDIRYQRSIEPIADQIAPAMQACASPGFYAEASDGPSIAKQLTTLFTSLDPGLALTQ